VPLMALIAPIARVSRSTNRSMPHPGDSRMQTTERYCRLGEHARATAGGRRGRSGPPAVPSSLARKTRYRPARRRRRSGDPYGNDSGGRGSWPEGRRYPRAPRQRRDRRGGSPLSGPGLDFPVDLIAHRDGMPRRQPASSCDT
jgi:hypothetical protein